VLRVTDQQTDPGGGQGMAIHRAAVIRPSTAAANAPNFRRRSKSIGRSGPGIAEIGRDQAATTSLLPPAGERDDQAHRPDRIVLGRSGRVHEASIAITMPAAAMSARGLFTGRLPVLFHLAEL
jgi:hypothetical protein